MPDAARAAFVAVVLLLLGSLSVYADFQRRLESEHFAISYTSGSGPDAVGADYALLVQSSLESAYTFYAASGFEMYESRIPVYILATEYGELGAEYNDATAGGLLPVIEIATPSTMEEALAWSTVETPLERLVESVCAHELFHVIQDVYSIAGLGDVAEVSFVEAHANAMAEFAFPEANDYIDASLELILGPDSVGFFHRTYDAAIFWIHVIDEYGMEALRDVMLASAAYEGRHAVDRAFAGRGLSFFDLWAQFAIALCTGGLRDAELFDAANPFSDAPSFGKMTIVDTALLPPPVYHATWTGQPLDVQWGNTTNERQEWPFVPEDVEGSPLRVAHAYGIDVLDFSGSTPDPMQILFSGDDETEFFVAVAVQDAAGWHIEPIDPGVAVLVEGPFDLARVIVTRTEPGTGAYALSISTPTVEYP